MQIPDIHFNRSIGEYKDKTFSINGDPLTAAAFEKHLQDVLPGTEDRAHLDVLFKERDWVYPVGEQTSA